MTKPRENEFRPRKGHNEYNKIRRDAWIAMGFCPMCLRPHDKFPAIQCSTCKFKSKVRNLDAIQNS